MSNQKQAMLFGLATVLLWSTVATAFKLALRELAPVQMLLIAVVSSVVVMAAILMVQGRWSMVFQLSRGQYAQSFGMGLINPCLYYFVLFGAFDRLPAQEAQPLNYTWALVLAYLSVPFLGQRLRKLDILAGLICYAGVVVIATRGAVTSLSFSDPLGVGLALGSTVIWASYWIIATRDTRDPVVGLFLNFLFGLPVIALICWWTEGLEVGSGTAFGAAVYVGVFEMGVAFVLWSYAMKKAENTSKVSNLIFISPFLSLVFIYFILGEQILASTYVGLILIMGGLWLQQKKVRRRQEVVVSGG
ncbi:Permease of the drug/metabolite transporter (DMT) superfamily [Marinobacter nitratireducens]|uniref:Permease of the drug/metabolite transporter (DMT) superfamily n=1 Tax=Marinobacter nitratireducens TaxID=1137280 RepID=A0A072N1R6_9GAMM|nr:DMT family transporter [Marinobacter nitratireducens]KEF31476.1 Permease of the drug/metabolite transporter (DMT) superfamily [Marinobacter nitratireducens]